MNLVRTVATCLVIMGGCNQSGDPPSGLTVGTLSHQSEPASDLPEGAIVLESIGYLLGDEDATPRDGSLVGLPFEAVQQIIGSDVAIETRAQTLGENAPTLVNTRVWRVGPNTSRITNVDIAWLQGERARLGVLR